MIDAPKEYASYLRKSRLDREAEAQGEEETLQRHRRILSELAHKLSIPIGKEYAEVVSGESIAARPQMQQLLEDIENGVWAGVLVMEVERLARGETIDQGIVAQVFKYSSAKIITPIKTYDPDNEMDENFFEFGLFMARQEYKTIKRRLSTGRMAAAKEGKWVANIVPYGYDRYKLQGQKGWSLKPNPETAPIIKLIFELYTKGDLQQDGSYQRIGVTLIARKLNSLGIPPPKGDVWVSASLRDMIINPVYIGKVRWGYTKEKRRVINGEIVKNRQVQNDGDYVFTDGQHEALIDEHTWNLAQEYMSQNPSRPGPKQYTTKNPLAGIMYCSVCGRSMVRRPPTNTMWKEVLMCPLPGCQTVSSELQIVETRVLQSLHQWLTTYKLHWDTQESISNRKDTLSSKNTQISRLEKDLQELSRQQNKVYELLEKGIYSVEVFSGRSKALQEKIKAAEQALAIIKEEINEQNYKENARKELIPQVEELLDVYDTLPTPAAKNNLLRQVVDKILYKKLVGGRWHASPDDFELTLYPKLPKHINQR